MVGSSEIEITENDVLNLLDQLTRAPPLLLKVVVRGNSNVVKSFQGQIEEYKDNLTDMELLKIRKVLEMPVEDLQNILHRVYKKTGKEQLKILSDPKAKPFIRKNLNEVGKIIFNN